MTHVHIRKGDQHQDPVARTYQSAEGCGVMAKMGAYSGHGFREEPFVRTSHSCAELHELGRRDLCLFMVGKWNRQHRKSEVGEQHVLTWQNSQAT
jgi:hypothetical protein